MKTFCLTILIGVLLLICANRIQERPTQTQLHQIELKKPDNEKTTRNIKPVSMGEMGFPGKSYLGVLAFCLMRNQLRTFRVDRILEIEEVN